MLSGSSTSAQDRNDVQRDDQRDPKRSRPAPSAAWAWGRRRSAGKACGGNGRHRANRSGGGRILGDTLPRRYGAAPSPMTQTQPQHNPRGNRSPRSRATGRIPRSGSGEKSSIRRRRPIRRSRRSAISASRTGAVPPGLRSRLLDLAEDDGCPCWSGPSSSPSFPSCSTSSTNTGRGTRGSGRCRRGAPVRSTGCVPGSS